MYRENILDHYKNPRNKRVLEEADIDHLGKNPICGDELRVQASVGEGTGLVRDVSFSGNGCAISQAAASMLTEFVKGKSLEELKKLTNDDIVAMLGIPISPTRLKCAILSLKCLEMGIKEYETGTKEHEVTTE